MPDTPDYYTCLYGYISNTGDSAILSYEIQGTYNGLPYYYNQGSYPGVAETYIYNSGTEWVLASEIGGSFEGSLPGTGQPIGDWGETINGALTTFEAINCISDCGALCFEVTLGGSVTYSSLIYNGQVNGRNSYLSTVSEDPVFTFLLYWDGAQWVINATLGETSGDIATLADTECPESSAWTLLVPEIFEAVVTIDCFIP